MDLHRQTARALAGMVRAKEVSAAEVADAFNQRIAALEPTINAYLHYDAEAVSARARALDERLAAGETAGILTGVPVGIKDNICTKGTVTTCASRMLEGFVPPYDATVIEKLADAGAVPAGKLNMDEFAMGSSSENSYFKSTKNPWNLERVPGGSSGGSAAAVAAGMVPLALGSDTGGSIRQPAAFCGVVGLKPTYGAVSRYGLVTFASSLEQIGPIARNVDDCALNFSAIIGADTARDATSKAFGFTYDIDDNKPDNLKNLRIGLPKEYFGPEINSEVRALVENAVKTLEKMGAEIVEVSLPSTQHALPTFLIISSAEASSNLARYDGVKYGFSLQEGGTLEEMYRASRSAGFGDEVKRRILLGTHVLSSGSYDAYFKRAKLMQRKITDEFTEIFQKCDLLATPTTPTTAFRLGERAGDPPAMYAADTLTAPVNIAGLPALSVPCGLDKDGMPAGLQLIGPKFSEARLFATAKAYETAVGGFPQAEVEA